MLFVCTLSHIILCSIVHIHIQVYTYIYIYMCMWIEREICMLQCMYCWCRELGSFKDCAFFFVSFCAGRVSEMGVQTFLFYRYWQIWRKHVARKLPVSQNLDKSTICHVFLKSTFQVFYISSCHRLSWFQIKPSTLYQNTTHYNTLMRFRGEEM